MHEARLPPPTWSMRCQNPPSYTAVRTFLRILEEKGYLTHTKQGRRYVYKTTQPRRRAGQSAIRRVLATFFDGSMEDAVAAYMADPQANIGPEELQRLAKLVEQAGKLEERR